MVTLHTLNPVQNTIEEDGKCSVIIGEVPEVELHRGGYKKTLMLTLKIGYTCL